MKTYDCNEEIDECQGDRFCDCPLCLEDELRIAAEETDYINHERC